MGEFDWISDLVKRPRVEIKKLATNREEIIIIKSRRKTTILRRRRRAGKAEFKRVSQKALEKVLSENPQIEDMTF